MQTKSNIFHWILYDFANSFVMIVFFLYFAQWIVIDQQVSDLYFNLTFTLSALLLLCTAPITGTLLDRSWRRITGLRITTIFTALFYGLCAWMAINQNNILALTFFTLGLYSYLLSFTFYTPLLHDIARPEKRGIISGLGVAANYLGQIAGLIIALPFATGKLSLFGGQARAETLLPGTIIFFLLALPMLIYFKEPIKKKISTTLPQAIKITYKETKHLLTHTSVLFFLLSYFLFNDAILTAVNNFPIFLEQVWHISDTTKTYLLLAVMITSAIGGILSGYIADKIGHKKTMTIILLVWLLIFPFIGLITHWTLFIMTCILLGLWFGANWAVSRSLMTCTIPPGKHNLAFAYFGLAERASSFIGPIVWGLLVTNLTHLGSTRYRIAMLSLAGFILLGLLMLRKVHNDKPHHVTNNNL
ncbi:MAG: MFS transporter [Nanoarchaeota archaeon]|nr:MFS transporter [Nanoarchaeota archaeon]